MLQKCAAEEAQMVFRRTVHIASDWFHTRVIETSLIKIASGFAGGIIFSAVLAVSWLGAWSAMKTPQQAPVASAKAANATPVTQPAAVRNSTPAADEHHAAQPVAPGKQVAKVPCERQAWPYREQRCLPDTDGPPATSRQAIRVISPDRGRSTTGMATTGDDGVDATARVTPPLPPQHALPSIAAAAAPPTDLSAGEATPEAMPIPLPPENPRRLASASMPAQPEPPSATQPPTIEPATTQPPTTQQHAAEALQPAAPRPQRKEPATAARKERAAVASRQDTAAEAAGDGNVRPSDWRPQGEPDRSRERADRSHRGRSERVTAQSRREPGRGRSVRVVRTLTMADGRRITVTQTYRNVPESEIDDLPISRRPYQRPEIDHYRLAPRRYIVEE
jgi:hypothetical protein